MSGRYEKEMAINQKVQESLKQLPSVFTDYYYSLVSAGKSYATAKNYIYYIEKFVKYYYPNNCPHDFYLNINRNNINKYMLFLRNTPAKKTNKRVSDSYLTTTWSALNSFFEFLVPDYIERNPVAGTDRPKMKDSPDVVYLTQREIATILRNVEKTADTRMKNRDLCILKLGFSTGLRVSAIAQIDIEDLDLENNKIKVIEKGNENFDVLIGSNLKQQILLWLEDREKYFNCEATNALFISRNSNRMRSNTIGDLIQKYGKVINKHITPHVMRHTCATNLYEKTGDIYLCANQLNHKNVTTTQRYAEISNSKKKKATDILDNLI